MCKTSLSYGALTCLCAVILCSSTGAAWGETPGFEPAKTRAVIVGVLKWQNRALTSYSPENRMDRELHDVLAKMGVPRRNMVLLLDEEAKLASIRKALHDVARESKKGETFIFYYAGHGTPSGKGICFLNYDAGPAESFAVSEIAEILKKEFHGERVLMFADCCFSGGLALTAKQLSDHGFQAASITSAAATNVSTNNWTFSHCLIDTLRGSSKADRNGDQVITLGEAATEVADAMKHHEYQKNGHSSFNMAEGFRLCRAAQRPAATKIPPPYKLFEYVQVQDNKHKWHSARVIDYRDDKFVAEIQQYSTRRVVQVETNQVRKFPFVTWTSRGTADVRPAETLSEKASLAKARVGGKYAQLLKRIKVENDFRNYSQFKDYGFYQATDYAGHADLPAGYWVYVYPYWYIWKSTNVAEKP